MSNIFRIFCSYDCLLSIILYIQGDSKLIVQILWGDRKCIRKLILHGKINPQMCTNVCRRRCVYPTFHYLLIIVFTFQKLVLIFLLFPLFIRSSTKPFTFSKAPKISLIIFIQFLALSDT